MTTPTFCMELVTWETDEILCLPHNQHSVAVKNPAMPDNGLGMTSLNFKHCKTIFTLQVEHTTQAKTDPLKFHLHVIQKQ